MPDGDFSYVATKENYLLVRCDQCGKLTRINKSLINLITGEISGNGCSCKGCGTTNTYVIDIDLESGFSVEVHKSGTWNELVFNSETDNNQQYLSPIKQRDIPIMPIRQPQQPIHVIVEDPHAAHCPKCGSTSITAEKKGYGYIKGGIGALAFGPLGFLAGGIGSKKMKAVCLKCGHTWKL